MLKYITRIYYNIISLIDAKFNTFYKIIYFKHKIITRYKMGIVLEKINYACNLEYNVNILNCWKVGYIETSHDITSRVESNESDKEGISENYGTPLFHDIDYNPVFTYKPFTPTKCSRTFREHIQRVKYNTECNHCQLRRRGGCVDDICHCE